MRLWPHVPLSRPIALAVTAVALGALPMTGAQIAYAATTTGPSTPGAFSCPPPGGASAEMAAGAASSTRYYLTRVKEAYRKPPANQRSYGDSGTVISIKRDTSYTVTGSISGSTTVEAGAIFAKASVQVGASVSKAKTVSTSTGASWRVPASQKRGWLEMGALGYDVSWYKKVWNSGNCRWTTIQGKTVKGVTASPWFRHS